MGQTQGSRQRMIQHKEVELDLWELDTDYGENDYDSGGHRNRADRIGVNRSSRSRAEINRNNRNRSEVNRNSTIRTADSRNNRNRAERNESNRSRTGSSGRQNSNRNLRLYEQGYGGSKECFRGSARPVQSIRRRQARKRKIYASRALAVSLVAMCLVLIYYMTGEIYRLVYHRNDSKEAMKLMAENAADNETDESTIEPPQIIEDYLEINDYSRPGTELKEVNSIFVHYTANSGTSAAQNRSYFANLPLTQERSASAHLIIGYDGEIIQCIPFDEQAYAVMTRNEDSISIECCYTSEDGSFTQETYDTLVHTLAWLIDKYNLSVDDILRHYDCGGKMCPIYYVEHEDAWEMLLRDVEFYGTI